MAGQRTTALAGLTADGRSTCAIRSMLRDAQARVRCGGHSLAMADPDEVLDGAG